MGGGGCFLCGCWFLVAFEYLFGLGWMGGAGAGQCRVDSGREGSWRENGRGYDRIAKEGMK